MSTHSPPKRSAPGREIAGAANLRLLATYRFSLIAQPHRAVRQCVACGRFVGNSNLGGYDGKSALSGRLWCLRCADGSAS